MKAAESTWVEIGEVSRETVVVLPTGSLEQHGPHLPLITDTLIVTAVAEGVESILGADVLLLPTIWLGCSAHHLPFAGSVSAEYSTYIETLKQIISNYRRHGFRKFVVLNGHGGNVEANRIALRDEKIGWPNDQFVQLSYYDLMSGTFEQVLTGPSKTMSHACEAETSLVLHLRPDLVRREKIRNDGLRSDPQIQGLVLNFDELSEEGSIGFATFGTAEKGKELLTAAIDGVAEQILSFRKGFVLTPIEE